MKKLLAAASAVTMLMAVSGTSFAEQENQNEALKEMRRQVYFMMLEMNDSHMSMLKEQERALNNYRKIIEMLQKADK
jgi:hypothetical protein